MIVTVFATFDIPHEEFTQHAIAQATEQVSDMLHEKGAISVTLQNIVPAQTAAHSTYDPTLDSYD